MGLATPVLIPIVLHVHSTCIHAPSADMGILYLLYPTHARLCTHWHMGVPYHKYNQYNQYNSMCVCIANMDMAGTAMASASSASTTAMPIAIHSMYHYVYHPHTHIDM